MYCEVRIVSCIVWLYYGKLKTKDNKMRDIIFRGERVDGKGWVYGDLIHTPTLKTRIIFFVDISSGVHDYEDHNYEVIPESVGQFTGLQDKDKNPIYEGVSINHPTYGKGVVKHDKVACAYYVDFGGGDWEFTMSVCKEAEIIKQPKLS